MSHKTHRCKYCKEKKPESEIVRVNLSWFCNYDHATSFAMDKLKTQSERQERDKIKKMRDSVKTRREWLKEAQAAFNAYIRIRDDKQPCISCGRHHQGQYHAGHFYTAKARPDIRFNLQNVNKQCSVCNNHLSGNLLYYRANLIAKIGVDKVEGLAMERPYKSDIEYLKRIKAIFTKKARLYKKSFR